MHVYRLSLYILLGAYFLSNSFLKRKKNVCTDYNNFIAGLQYFFHQHNVECPLSHWLNPGHKTSVHELRLLMYKECKVRTVLHIPYTHLIYCIQISTVLPLDEKRCIPRMQVRFFFFFEERCFCLAMNFPIIADCGLSESGSTTIIA